MAIDLVIGTSATKKLIHKDNTIFVALAIAPVIQTSPTKKLIRKNNTIFVALAIASNVETSTTNLKTNTQKQHYSNSHSYEVHNEGILGNSDPPLTPPRRGIERNRFVFRQETGV